MKRILMIGTGGTIASEMTPEGLSPDLTPAQLLHAVPSISSLCEVDCLSLFSIDSTNITPAHYLRLAVYRRGAVLSCEGGEKAHHPHRRAEADQL